MIREMGGQTGSIPDEPFGTEYRITFRNREFSAGDLERLAVLNRLTGRNTVAVAFVSTNLTSDDIAVLRRKLPGIAIFRIVDGDKRLP